MLGMNLTREEAQERARIIGKVFSYNVKLDLTDSEKVFRSETTVKFSAQPGASTFIDAITETVYSVTLNGRQLDPATVVEGARIHLPHVEEKNTLHIVADATYMHSGEGLHRLIDPVDQEVYVYTQFEVPDSRRMYAVFEQPDLKSTYTFTVTVPDHWVVISNAPAPEPTPAAKGTAIWAFPETKVMSSYITALVAGPFKSTHDEFLSISGQRIPLGLYARTSMFAYLDASTIFAITKQGFEFYEKIFKTPYPFEKYDQLFVPDFNAGAMENAGCVTYRESYIFRSKVSDAIIERRGLTLLHELAHMWFGDLVTMKWWNDLWLNESFAEFMSALCSAENTQWKDAWTTFSIMEKTWAYRQDQLSSTHPIMANIRDLDDIQVNFDGITYAKGASVLRQLVAWVGQEKFMAGIVAYFHQHAWGNTELPDLIHHLEKTSGRDLSEWTAKWLETEGVNILSSQYDIGPTGDLTSFAIAQSNDVFSHTLRPHRIGIGFYNLKDATVVRDQYFEVDIDGPLTHISEVIGYKLPDFILLNDQDLAYAKIHVDKKSLEFAKKHLAQFENSLARSVIWTSLWEMVRDAKFSSIEYIDLILKNIDQEKQSTMMMILLRQLNTCIDFYVPEEKISSMSKKIAHQLLYLAQQAQPGSDTQYQLALNFTYYAQETEHLTYLEALRNKTVKLEGLDIDTDLDWSLLFALVAGGYAHQRHIQETVHKDNTTAGHAKAAYSYAALPTAEAKNKAWKELTTNENLSNTMLENIGAGFNRTHDNTFLEPFIDQYFRSVKEIWKNRSHEIAELIVEFGFPSYAISENTCQRVHVWLDENKDAPAGLVRHITESKDIMERALKVRHIS